jgi:hypothetical protein
MHPRGFGVSNVKLYQYYREYTHKNANFDTMCIEVSVFILHTPAVKMS